MTVRKANSSNKSKLGLKELIAMGIGGMVGGGIFSVLGLAVAEAGHAAPVAFALGGIVALLTGWSYIRLGLHFHSDGGSFTYLEHAFKHPNIAGIGGWLLLTGYIGTLALYAYTFGAYGGALLGSANHAPAVQHALESFVMLAFLGLNLYGIRAAGIAEDLTVAFKLLILLVFAVAGLCFIKADHVLPLFNQGSLGLVIGAGLIFVAYEGFELIPNAVNEMQHPRRDLGRSILISISITAVIYVLVSLVAVGNLLPAEIARYKEYALAVAAKPFLGAVGFTLIAIAALLSTASAINATMFGTARLGMVMAREKALPKAFSLKERRKDIPWVSLLVITATALVFVNTTDLTIISSFASSTFLAIFAAINLSALRLRRRIGITAAVPLAGIVLCIASGLTLLAYLWKSDLRAFVWIAGLYTAVVAAEFLFSERRLLFRRCR